MFNLQNVEANHMLACKCGGGQATSEDCRLLLGFGAIAPVDFKGSDRTVRNVPNSLVQESVFYEHVPSTT